jgi:spore coat protein F
MAEMTEQDLLGDLLNQEKLMMSSCALHIQEASCPTLRKVLMDQFSRASQDEYNVLDQMRQKGYFKAKEAEDKDVKLAKNNLNNMRKTLQ